MINSLRVHSFNPMDSSIGIKFGQRSRGLLTNDINYDPSFTEVAHAGHRGMDEVLIGKNPVLKVNFTGKVMLLAGTFSAMAPMSAIHKGYFADCYNEISHGFSPESAASGYWIASGKLKSPQGDLHEASVEMRWFEPANDNVTIVPAPAAP